MSDDSPDLELKVIQKDVRGEIYSLLLPTNQELMIFFCKAGHLRGGHSHDVPEVILVLTGLILYHKIRDGREEVLERRTGDVIYNLSGEVHMAEFLEDSWVIEWKIGVGVGQWKTTNFPPLRRLVERSG